MLKTFHQQKMTFMAHPVRFLGIEHFLTIYHLQTWATPASVAVAVIHLFILTEVKSRSIVYKDSYGCFQK